jgi:exonuclease SbcC
LTQWNIKKIERNKLFEGKPIETVINEQNEQGKKINLQLADLTEKKNKYTVNEQKIMELIKIKENETAKLTIEYHTLEKEILQWINIHQPTLTIPLLNDMFTKNIQWIQLERTFFNELKLKNVTAIATLEERKKVKEIQFPSDNMMLDEQELPLLRERLNQKNVLLNEQNTKREEIKVKIASHLNNMELHNKYVAKLDEKKRTVENWAKLNELLGSASGSKFKEIAQEYTLEMLLGYTNKHLEQLSQRYRLERIPHSLGLQVIDLEMLREVRTVHSLSGGETFLISLALALGLSSLSSKQMKVESLFIDEGFGSLDVETLHIAMDTLERMQRQGRKIGIITHIAEMTERIPVQIKIVKSGNGESKIL